MTPFRAILNRGRKLALLVCVLSLPGWLLVTALRALGNPIHTSARIGFSFVWVDSLAMAAGTRIGHFNFLNCRKILMRSDAKIRSLNYVRGPLSLRMGTEAFIGRLNQIVRAAEPISVGPASLYMSELSQITSGHRFDCMRSIRIGANSTFGGTRSQVWTHGYIHERKGRGRVRVDGNVVIGENVSIGSSCIISMGITIGDGVNVGSHSSIAQDLVDPGLYVSQPLRYIPKVSLDYERELTRDPRITLEKVYLKPRTRTT